MTQLEYIKQSIKDILDFSDMCDCDIDAKDRGEMCDDPWFCFKEQIRNELKELSE